ncbi:MAG: hypothetical protein KDD48_01705 [Bdellovibrionales bacterium]|nr:hypothetical protein [Bdellovibrionales bacterium]
MNFRYGFYLGFCSIVLAFGALAVGCSNRPNKFENVKSLQEASGSAKGSKSSGSYKLTLNQKSEFLNGHTQTLTGHLKDIPIECNQNDGSLKCELDDEEDLVGFKGPIQQNGAFKIAFVVQDVFPKLKTLGLKESDIPSGASASFAFMLDGKFTTDSAATGKFTIDYKARDGDQRARYIQAGTFEMTRAEE